MKAVPLLHERHVLGGAAFAELVVWKVPRLLKGSRHMFKYRLALVSSGECVLRFDNEADKGDHVHKGDRERPYGFVSPEKLVEDFWVEVDGWRASQ